MKNFISIVKRRFVRSYSHDIDLKTLREMIANINNVFLIDVRTKDEFKCGHINGAINIPLQDISERIEKVVRNKNDVIIAYCEYGGRSRKACVKLEKMGYVNVYNLKDGWR